MKKHTLLMIGCIAVPLLLIILLPILGIKNNYIIPIAMLIMCGSHLFMMGDHKHH
ncbi:MAG TPA: hypothetical protein VFF28_02550 [Candidatus Nanoarchaeia archaeon]|nr:hypothetical protein [Candidatus Nanoarchaeia archaeon]